MLFDVFFYGFIIKFSYQSFLDMKSTCGNTEKDHRSYLDEPGPEIYVEYTEAYMHVKV